MRFAIFFAVMAYASDSTGQGDSSSLHAGGNSGYSDALNVARNIHDDGQQKERHLDEEVKEGVLQNQERGVDNGTEARKEHLDDALNDSTLQRQNTGVSDLVQDTNTQGASRVDDSNAAQKLAQKEEGERGATTIVNAPDTQGLVHVDMNAVHTAHDQHSSGQHTATSHSLDGNQPLQSAGLERIGGENLTVNGDHHLVTHEVQTSQDDGKHGENLARAPDQRVDEDLSQKRALHDSSSHPAVNSLSSSAEQEVAPRKDNSGTSSMNTVAVQTDEQSKIPRGDRLVINGVETSYDMDPHEMISILEREMRLADLAIKLNYQMMSAGGLVNEAAARIIYMSSLVDLTNLIIEQSETLKKHLADTGTMISTTMDEIEKLRTYR